MAGAAGGRSKTDRCHPVPAIRYFINIDMQEKIPIFHGPRLEADKFPNAVRVGNLIFTSGHVAMDENGVVIQPENCAAQAEIIFGRLQDLLLEAGSGMEHVVKITAHIADASDYTIYNELRHRWFPAHHPASTTVVSGLVKPGLMVEIEVIAIRPDE